uniref:Uncharacterized protein n=1 Tax=Arundo donax TaxID=35708 RepID=A0A0A9DV27_ARUDO
MLLSYLIFPSTNCSLITNNSLCTAISVQLLRDYQIETWYKVLLQYVSKMLGNFG